MAAIRFPIDDVIQDVERTGNQAERREYDGGPADLREISKLLRKEERRKDQQVLGPLEGTENGQESPGELERRHYGVSLAKTRSGLA